MWIFEGFVDEVDRTPWTRHDDASIKNQRKDSDDEFMKFHFRGF